MSDFKPVNQTVTPTSADPGEEFPFLHTITVVDRVVSVDKPELVQNNIKTETVTLNLDSEWDGLSCIINIGNGDTPTSLIWSGQPVTIPAELMTYTGTLNVSVVGYGDDGALRAVTKKADAMFTVVASGYVEGDEPVPDPTTILGQLTEAADRANQAAQNADDSTIDKVDVTMLPTGSDPSGSVSDKTLSLSIPNGPQGPQGPKGDPGDLTTVAHDATLTGDGTSGNVLRQAEGSCLRNRKASSLNDSTNSGFYKVLSDTINVPARNHRGVAFVVRLPESSVGGQLFFSTYDSETVRPRLFARASGDISQSTQWMDWVEFAKTDDLSKYVPLSTYKALETKVQALQKQPRHYIGWQDPAETGATLHNGDLWLKTPHYLTDIDPDNPTEGASTAEYYTYAQGVEDNSPSVLVRTGQVITDLLEYSDGAWWSLIWRVESSFTPGRETTQVTAASALSDAELLTRIEALEAEVNSLKGAK